MKSKVAFLLAVVLLLSPLNAFARVELPDPTKNIDDDILIEEPEMPQEKSQSEVKSEVEEPTEEPAKVMQKSEDPIPEIEKDEKVEKDEEEENELEISDELQPEKITVSPNKAPGGIDYDTWLKNLKTRNGSFVLKKVDENGNPMKVVFKITNTETGETHIVATDENGVSQTIILSNLGEVTLEYSDPEDNHFSKKDRLALLEKMKQEGLLPEDAKPDVFVDNPEEPVDIPNKNSGIPENPPGGGIIPPPKAPPIHQPSDGEPDVQLPPVPAPEKNPDENINDKYIVGGQVGKVYEYEKFSTEGYVRFVNRTNSIPEAVKGTLKISIRYGNMITLVPGSGAPPIFWQTPGAKDDEFVYENVTLDDVKKIDQKKIKEFAHKRMAQYLLPDKQIDVGDFGYSIYFENGENEYKIEELRTDTNKYYSLKELYLKNTGKTKIVDGKEVPGQLIGEKKEDIITTPKEYILPDGSTKEHVTEEDTKEATTSVFEVDNKKFGFSGSVSDGTDKEGKVVEQGEETKIVDTISFDGLTPGKAYEFRGKLINKRTGEEVKTKNPILLRSRRLDAPNGTAKIGITFDSSEYEDGDEFVLVYDVIENGLMAGEFRDTNNAAQTFKIKGDKPNPDKPNPDKPNPDKPTPTPNPDSPTPTPNPNKPVPNPETQKPSPEVEIQSAEREHYTREEEVAFLEIFNPQPVVEVKPEEEVPQESVIVEKVEVINEEPQVTKVSKQSTPNYMAPKTYDAGMGLSIVAAVASGAGLLFLKKKR